MITIQCQLTGLRPLMFDRYAGDNTTQLPTAEKLYLTPERLLTIPAINLYSLLCSENSSVTKMFFGKQGKMVGLGIKSYTTIEPFEIPILDKQGQIRFEGFNEQIKMHYATARVKKGSLFIPQSKERPLVSLPWRIEFTVNYIDNKFCTPENLRQCFEQGGTLGLGTFRPFFGRYQLTRWESK